MQEHLNARSLEILNALVETWAEGDYPLPGDVSYAEFFAWLERLGAKKPTAAIESLEGLMAWERKPKE